MTMPFTYTAKGESNPDPFSLKSAFGTTAFIYVAGLTTDRAQPPLIVFPSSTSSPSIVPYKLNLSDYNFMDETMTQNVRNFINDNPQVERELLRARPIIRNIFGDRVSLELKISEDPDYPTLKTTICYIHTSLSVDVAEVALQSFYKTFLNPPNRPVYKGGGIADRKLIIDLYLD